MLGNLYENEEENAKEQFQDQKTSVLYKPSKYRIEVLI